MDKVVHFEVPFDDADRAHTFYREAFGWQLNSMPDMGYTLVTTTPTGDAGPTEPGGINGGMLARQGAITSPVITIGVEDIDDSLARIEKARRFRRDRPPAGGRHGLQRVCRRYRGQPHRPVAERVTAGRPRRAARRP
jgi:uncharacterized protein